MRYVLDSCVALKYVLPEPDSAAAERVLDDYHNNVIELPAPDIFPIEIAHALARAERRKLISPGEGATKLAEFLNHPPTLHSYLPLLPKAFDIASHARIGVYDCLYVALAEQEGCELLTADERLVRALRPIYPFIVSLSTLP